MKRAFGIILVFAFLSLAGLLAVGSCRREKTPENEEDSGRVSAQTKVDTTEQKAATPEVSAELPKDPENVIRFTIAYQNNVNGEIEPCG